MYSTLFKKVLFPLYESGFRRRDTLKYLRLLDENQWQSQAELEVRQWQHLMRLLQHAYKQSPYYRQVFKDLGLQPEDIRNYDDFRKLPICSREDVVAHNEQMIASDQRTSVIRKTTGGSTGVPVQFAIDRDSYEWRNAATQRGYAWAGCEAGRHTLYLWGADIGDPAPLQALKTRLYHRFFNRKMFNCFKLDAAEMRRCVDYINRQRPTGIVAFTTAVYNLARFIDDNKIKCAPVPAVIIGAEKLYEHQRELIERVLQTRVFNTYGCREFMLIAAECDRHEGLHITMDNLFVEILHNGKPVAPGERGEIVITDLHNFGMPFIRYRNGDLVIRGSHACSCGRGLPLIEDIDGRLMDEIVSVEGKVLSGGFFPHLMKEFSEIEKFQVVQEARDRIDISIVPKQPLARAQLDFCSSEIRKVTGEAMRIDYHMVDDIPLSASGKYRVTVSRIAGQNEEASGVRVGT